MAISNACGASSAIRSDQRVGGGEQVLVGDDLVHEAQSLGLGRVDVLAAGEEGERALVAEPPGQRPARADLGQQPEPPEGRDEQRPLGGDRRSQVSAKASPTPAAGPLIAAMTALSVRAIGRTTPPKCRRIQRQTSVEPLVLGEPSTAGSIIARSPPAEKPSPRR